MAGKPPRSSSVCCWWHPPRGVERGMWFKAVNEVQEAVGEPPVSDPEEGGHSASALFVGDRAGCLHGWPSPAWSAYQSVTLKLNGSRKC